MIQTFRHRGLKRLYQRGDHSALSIELLPRIEDVLAHLDSALRHSDMDLPGYRLHRLRGRLKGYWSITISGNWRIIFRLDDGDVYDVELIDYH